MISRMDLRMLDGAVVTSVTPNQSGLMFGFSDGTSLLVPLAAMSVGLTAQGISEALGYTPSGPVTRDQLISTLGYDPQRPLTRQRLVELLGYDPSGPVTRDTVIALLTFTPINSAVAAPGALFELGRYIDMHASNTANDYDVRLECTPPTGGSGTGDFNVFAARIYTPGNLRVDGNISGLSDIRVKKDIRPIRDSLEITAKLNGVTYARRDQPEIKTRYVGLLAQDVQKVLPEAVVVGEDELLSVMYSNLAGLFVENVKDLMKENAALRATVEDLHKKMNDLELVVNRLLQAR